MKSVRKIFQALILHHKEQTSSLILLACIVVALVVNHHINAKKDIPPELTNEYQLLLQLQDSINLTHSKQLYAFNPNTADSVSLQQLNIPSYIKKNIIAYRKKGGYYKQKNDLRKIYGMTDSIYTTLEPYIIIEPQQKTIAENQTKQALNSENIHLQLFAFNPNTINETELNLLALPESIKKNLLKYRANGGIFYNKHDLRKIYGMTDSIYTTLEPYIIIEPQQKTIAENQTKQTLNSENIQLQLFTFNPNTINEAELNLLALPESIKKNLLKYRASGGQFYNKNDMQKLYGMTPQLFHEIAPYINIPNTPLANTPLTIELNSATAEELKKLKGIGETLSERIIKYRELLGGFAQVEQLHMVYGMPKETIQNNLPYLSCDNTKIKRIRVNLASYADLKKHPLINPNQAEQIIALRSKKGYLNHFENLIESIFTENEYKLLQYYLEY